MHPETSHRFNGLPPYPLAGIPETRRRLLEEGVDVIDLSAGDADLAPPPSAVRGLQKAVENPAMSRYPFNLGLADFRQEVAGWMKKRFGVEVDPAKEILPLIGSKDGIAHLPFGFLNPGEGALIPDPGYQPYKGGVWLAGGEPILVPLRPENDFLIPVQELPAEDVARSKILYLNYPNNPTTALAPRAYLQEVVEFCHANDLLLVYDNAYSEVAFDGYRPPSILEIDGGREVSLEFHSFSKTYNMTGWRMGWAVGDAKLVAILGKVKSFMDTGAFLGIQAACAEALRSWNDWVPSNIEVFRLRRDAAVEALRSEGFDVTVPKATMYLWIPVPTGETSMDFCRRALEREGVIVLPGSSMGKGGEGFFRIALTTSEERLRLAASRLRRLLA
ncbi:MAG: aminotransferase class I/II-fold pyridoxal phosphate-dependent enzyme [Gemmatimonadota bacterium]|jgi:LL-diaminopimelate aminotransferase